MLPSTARCITLLALLSTISFYVGFVTNIIAANENHHLPSTAPASRRRLDSHEASEADDSNNIINLIQKCYGYNYFSDECIQDNREIRRRVDEVIHPTEKSRGKVHRNAGDTVGDISSSFLTGSASIPKKDLMNQFDRFGVPTLHANIEEDALLLYNSFDSLPSNDPNYITHQRFATRYSNITEALGNCAALNVQFFHNPSSNAFPMCTIHLPSLNNLPAYHIQRWMRKDGRMQHVGSLTTPSGVNKFDLPKYHPVISKHWNALQTFLENVDHVLEEVETIIKERFEKLRVEDNTVITMTVDRGDVDLLVNFLCSAQSRELDVRRILVFVTDEETKQLIESLSSDGELGVMVYFDQYNLSFAHTKGGDGQKYGDEAFISMMFAKILCVLYPLLLGFDVLYQDADIVWYQSPLRFFQGDHPDSPKSLNEYDIIFQHDGSPQPRFAPFSANSGFYYVKSNKRTQYLTMSLLYHGDLIRKTTSHQQVLTHLLLEHSSMMGLKVKVLDDVDVLPGGNQYQHDQEYMHRLIAGDISPLIFHMYWTDGKKSKVDFLQQLGEWYVQEDSSTDIEYMQMKYRCSEEPILSCHYRDKPSKIPCLDSPLHDKNGASFW